MHSHAFDALDAEAPEGPGGDLMSWGHCRFMRFIRFGPGSESNASNASKVAPRTFDPDTTPDSRASDSDESNGSNASQVLALGAGFGSIRFMIHLLHSTRRPRVGPGWEHGSNVLGGTVACIPFIRFGPGSASNESTASKVAPRTLDSDTTPDAAASQSDAPNRSNASQVLALGGRLWIH